MISLKQILLETHCGKRLIEAGEATPATTYEFQDSFPDNIVLPIKPKQPDITSFDKITSVNQLTPSLQNFINTLNAAVKANKLVKGTITITSEAAAATKATNVVPGGDSGEWNQAQVNFSYSNGAKMNNQTLADRRAEGIEYVIKKFVKLSPEIKIIKSGNGNGTKKSARAVIPIQTLSKNSPATTFTKEGKKETFDLAAKKYTPPAFTDPKIEVVDCGKSLDANGMAGNPIAYRSKLQVTSGTLTVNFNPAYIPDRLVILKMTKGQGNPAPIFDSGYMSTNPAEALVDFGKALDDLNKTVKNGYDGNIKQITPISVDLGEDDGSIYYIEVYAPLGPTVWGMTVACNVAGEALAINLANITKPDVVAALNKKNSKIAITTAVKNRWILNIDQREDSWNEYITAAPDATSSNPTGAELIKFVQALNNNGTAYTVSDPSKLNTKGADGLSLNSQEFNSSYLKQILGTNYDTISSFLANKLPVTGKKFTGNYHVNIGNRYFTLKFNNGTFDKALESTKDKYVYGLFTGKWSA
jgi:hypothetical protein